LDLKVGAGVYVLVTEGGAGVYDLDEAGEGVIGRRLEVMETDRECVELNRDKGVTAGCEFWWEDDDADIMEGAAEEGVGDTEVARRASFAADMLDEEVGVPRVVDKAFSLLSSERRLWHSWDLESYFILKFFVSASSFPFTISISSSLAFNLASTLLATLHASECAKWFMRIARRSAALRCSDDNFSQ
jgi:hypothetical protein